MQAGKAGGGGSRREWEQAVGSWMLNIRIFEKKHLAKLKLPQTSDDPNFNRPRRVTEEALQRTNYMFSTQS